MRITKWTGLETALDGGNALVADDTVVSGFAEDSPAVWRHPDVPFWQFAYIYLETAAGVNFTLVGEGADDRPGGLLLAITAHAPEPDRELPGSLSRFRVLDLPTGTAKLSVQREAPEGAVVDASLQIAGHTIRLLCAEVYRRRDCSFDIVAPSESILVQLNGSRPD